MTDLGKELGVAEPACNLHARTHVGVGAGRSAVQGQL